MESNSWFKSMVKRKVTTFNSRVDIFIHTKRKRLVDPDGISPKAAIDGLVHSGVLKDDTSVYIRKVEMWSQEKVKADEEEETIITIREV